MQQGLARASLALPFLLSLPLAGCRSMQFRDVTLLEHGIDEDTQSSELVLSFEVWRRGLPVQDLEASEFTVYEDGIESTSESFSEVGPTLIKLPITLLLDTSLSMQESGAIEPLLAAATDFVETMRSEGFEVSVYRFARTVEPVESIEAIPASFSPDQRWTALYHAVRTALEADDRSILVVLSDGADNYSHNHGTGSLAELEELIDAGERQIHAVGFGNIREEHDRNGVRGTRALKRLAVNGTCQVAEAEGGFEAVFDHIAERMPAVYTYRYYSPSVSGKHELVIRVDRERRSGRSPSISFGTE